MFIIYSIIIAVAYFGFIRILWQMMQDGEMLDVVTFGMWSKMKKRMYSKRNKFEYLLGGCEKCTSFWWALPYCIGYWLLMKDLELWQLGYVGSFIWLSIFWTGTASIGAISLSKLNKTNDV